jgi:hypothetical protein
MLAIISVAAVALVGAGCGAGASESTPSVVHPATLPQAQPLEKQVQQMVLATNDLDGWAVTSSGAEKLSDQLVPKTVPGADATNSFVRKHWRASYHTALRHGTTVVLSDANVFDSAASASHIWSAEKTVVIPGQHANTVAKPGGTPPGTIARFIDTGKLSAYELGWSQGPVIGLVFVYVHGRLPAAREKATLALLARAAAKQSGRTDQVFQDHAAALAAR